MDRRELIKMLEKSEGFDDLLAENDKLRHANEALKETCGEFASIQLVLVEACKAVRFVVNSAPDLHYLRQEPWWKMLNAAIEAAKLAP